MTSGTAIHFMIGVKAIERAYRASRKAFEDQIAEVDAKWQQHMAAVQAGTAVTSEEDEDTGVYFDYGEYMGELEQEAEEGLRLVREAFVLSLYHYWEKKVGEYLKVKKYNQDKVFAAFKGHPEIAIDEAGIDRLRRIANCIKHGGGKLLFDEYPTLFEITWIGNLNDARGWHDALRLKDVDVEQAFETIRSSGPRAKPWLGKVDEIVL